MRSSNLEVCGACWVRPRAPPPSALPCWGGVTGSSPRLRTLRPLPTICAPAAMPCPMALDVVSKTRLPHPARIAQRPEAGCSAGSGFAPPRPCPRCMLRSTGRTCSTAGRRSVSSPAASTSDVETSRQETSEEAHERRMRESQRVEERVEVVFTYDEFQERLEQAGQQLVVLEVESSQLCETGMEEAELHWEQDKKAALNRCSGLKHIFQRTARDSPDVVFLTLEADTEEGQEACDWLGVEVLPTLQFWRNKQKLWEHRGILQLEEDLGQGVLYYGNQAAGGVKASEFVQELESREQLDTFLANQDERMLAVVMVSAQSVSACVRIFAAILALAKNFVGYAAFGRLIADASPATSTVAEELQIREVPTFVFFRAGKEIARKTSSSRADLIGTILQLQNELGLTPPPPPARPATPRRPMQRRKSNKWGSSA